MTINRKLFFDYCIGIVLGMIIAKHTISGIVGINPTPILFVILMLLSIYGIRNFTFDGKVNVKKIPVALVLFTLLLYSFFSTIINEKYRFDLLLDSFLIFLLFIVAINLRRDSFVSLLNTVVFLSSLLAVALIIDRSFVKAQGINYLLLSLPLGISFIICINNAKSINNIFCRTVYLMVGALCFIALFFLQSRAVVITAIIFSFISLTFDTRLKKVLVKFFVVVFIGLLVSIAYSDVIFSLYESSSLYQRMNGLLTGETSEPRARLYSDYFSSLCSFYFSGFGMGGTEDALYLNTAEKYPHNFILEFTSEFGILGMLFSLSITIAALIQCIKLLVSDKENLVLVFFFLYYLINFMKSFTIYQSTFLFVAFGLLFNANLYCKKNF
ncbi:O-antigen ligase family protein [Shewanella sp. SM23]|uniref:O-antigen ligase family protein n=1 Tax=Shewanella sp. SM23 TaxID=2912794 RepID=UPI0021D99D36|nr:O-antigen ligase family protein [Shewanella sp. SM23]MCU8082686.1 O-antigen ligase family protein [Shewanella sp. SM23]